MSVEKNRKLMFILALVSIGLSAIVCIPFGLAKVTLFEVILKYIVIPVAIIALTILFFVIKYGNYNPSIKFATVTTYTPLFSYVCAILFNTLLIIVRNNIYSQLVNTLLLLVNAVLLVLTVFLSHYCLKKTATLQKNMSMLADSIFVVLAVLVTIGDAAIAFDYNKFGSLGHQSVLLLLVPIALVLVVGGLHALLHRSIFYGNDVIVMESREDLHAKWNSQKEQANNIYQIAHEDILATLFEYAAEELGLEAVEETEEVAEKEVIKEVEKIVKVVDNTKVEKLEKRVEELENELDDALNVIEASKVKILETLQKCADNDSELILTSLNDSLNVITSEKANVIDAKEKFINDNNLLINELQAQIDAYNEKLAAEEAARLAAEEEARLEAERRAREAEERAKDRKIIEPPFEQFVNAAANVVTDGEETTTTANDKQTLYRFTSNKKTFVSLQLTNNDYRIQFYANDDQMRELLYQYTSVMSFVKKVEYKTAKYSLNLIKAIFKGDESLSFEVVNELMKKSLDNLVEAENLELSAKAAEKAAKERARLAEKVLREQEREKLKEEQREAKLKAAAEKVAKENESLEENLQEQPLEESNSEEVA